jgi:hypothetical protein
MYANWWPNALDVAKEIYRRYDELSGMTRLYHDTLYDTTLPRWIMDLVSSQSSIIRTQTLMWLGGDVVAGYEGCEAAAQRLLERFREIGLQNVGSSQFPVAVPLDQGTEHVSRGLVLDRDRPGHRDHHLRGRRHHAGRDGDDLRSGHRIRANHRDQHRRRVPLRGAAACQL